MNTIELNRDDFHWLVGLLEGEGCFMKGSPSSPNTPKIVLSMTDKDIIDRVGLIFDRKTSILKPRNIKHKIAYRVICVGRKAIELMEKLQPYMSIRRKDQIQVVLESYDSSARIKFYERQRKMSEESILEIKPLIDNKEISLREGARRLKVNHESLRKRLIKLNGDVA